MLWFVCGIIELAALWCRNAKYAPLFHLGLISNSLVIIALVTIRQAVSRRLSSGPTRHWGLRASDRVCSSLWAWKRSLWENRCQRACQGADPYTEHHLSDPKIRWKCCQVREEFSLQRRARLIKAWHKWILGRLDVGDNVSILTCDA